MNNNGTSSSQMTNDAITMSGRKEVLRRCMLLLLAGCCLCAAVQAQKAKTKPKKKEAAPSRELVIPADSLSSAAKSLAGDPQAWNILVALARRDEARNTFILGIDAQQKLRDLRALTSEMSAARTKLDEHIKQGARLFAEQALQQSASHLRVYNQALAEGVYDEAMTAGRNYCASVAVVGEEIAKNRTMNVDAKLNRKSGEVDKRKGLIGEWRSVDVGALFAEADGLRTGVKSYAQLMFVDGSDVVIDPSSTVLIRSSRVDRLDQSAKTDMALVTGSLLAKPSAKAKEGENFTFRAGSAQSNVRSGKFWASNGQNERVQVANYDGELNLSSANVRVTVHANQGTIVEKGKPPIKPVELLPPPMLAWGRQDTVVTDEKILLAWNSVKGAASYGVEICLLRDFSSSVQRTVVRETRFELRDLPMAEVYIRLQSNDKLGLRGGDSPVYRLVRSVDTQPPPITLPGWDTDVRYTVKPVYVVKGVTEPGARFTVNGSEHVIAADGSFTLTMAVQQPETRLQLAAADRAGNVQRRTLSIIPMNLEQVARIAWDCSSEEGVIHPATDKFLASGTAYPGIRVTAVVGGTQHSAATDSQGRWVMALSGVKGQTVEFEFVSISDEMSILKKSFRIQ